MDAAIADIESLVNSLSATQSVPVHFDVTDMRGYQYHTGVIFACYSSGVLQPIARGGRYDNIGSAFGLSLPATGFSLDLRSALDLLPNLPESSKGTIFVPADSDSELKAAVERFKADGYRVIKSYDLSTLNAGDKKLVKQAADWTLETV